MPAPFVIAHWQIGLRLADAGAPLGADTERAAVYLTNALTGWQPPQGPKQHLIFPELEQERDAAEHVKRDVKILVVIGNPPYNAFAGVSPAEEEGLVELYKAGLQAQWGIRKFNLDELYIRFLRVAERRIVEQTGRGIVCYISSYSYLSDASFVVVRRHLLEGFDAIWIDSLNGDSRETGKLTPAGDPDPSIFSTEFNREGIRLGTAIGLYVRRDGQTTTPPVRYRDFWGARKRDELVSSMEDPDLDGRYVSASPSPANRYSLRPQDVSADYTSWPRLVDLAEAEPFSGVQEMRKGALISIDRASLHERMRRYFDDSISFATLKAMHVGPVEDAAAFAAQPARVAALKKEAFDPQRLRRYAMYPLDQRWCYHTNVARLLNRSRPEFTEQVFDGNLFIATRMAARRPDEGLPIIPTRVLANYHLLDPNSHAFPIRLGTTERRGLFENAGAPRANLSDAARAWLTAIGWPNPDATTDAGAAPWLHVLAICYAPNWLAENRDGVLADWPRVPLAGSAEALRGSATLGARLASLLDPDERASGIATGTPKPPLGVFGAITRTRGGSLAPAELALTAGWGHGGAGRPVMPSRGRLTERDAYTADELAQIETAAAARGETAVGLVARLGPPVDVWLNEVAYWRTVPRAVWEFHIGGYQVVKKWLSYREAGVLGRPLSVAEAREVTTMIRRLAAIVIMQPELDANYRTTRDNAYPWPSSPVRPTVQEAALLAK